MDDTTCPVCGKGGEIGGGLVYAYVTGSEAICIDCERLGLDDAPDEIEAQMAKRFAGGAGMEGAKANAMLQWILRESAREN